MVKPSENVRKFYDVRFGELNIAVNGGGRMYCLMDICRILNLLKREGDKIVKSCGCKTRDYFVKRTKTVVSRLFVDESGLVSLATESRKNNADKFRVWAEGLVKVPVLPLFPAGGIAKGGLDSKAVGEDDVDDYPTVGQYFKNYVPLDYFIPLLSDTLKDYLEISKNEPDYKKRSIEHRVSVLNTFNVTLIANMKKGTFQCK